MSFESGAAASFYPQVFYDTADEVGVMLYHDMAVRSHDQPSKSNKINFDTKYVGSLIILRSSFGMAATNVIPANTLNAIVTVEIDCCC